jgi:hypothetical protein
MWPSLGFFTTPVTSVCRISISIVRTTSALSKNLGVCPPHHDP